ncbi:hypothetical protein GA0115259_1091616, partial [Streptomyces sp. MnatMP-M17]
RAPPTTRRGCRGGPGLGTGPGPGPAGIQRIGMPDRVRAITRRWISLVPSKIV